MYSHQGELILCRESYPVYVLLCRRCFNVGKCQGGAASDSDLLESYASDILRLPFAYNSIRHLLIHSIQFNVIMDLFVKITFNLISLILSIKILNTFSKS